MQSTFRAHHNFALAHAIDVANVLGVPVLVYHGLRRDYPWANDRLHTFILESVVDLGAAFATRGIQYSFWLDQDPAPGVPWGDATKQTTPPGPPSALKQLADRAALVVTDFLPTFIHPRQISGLRRKTATPVVAVDSATVVPMRFHDRAHLSAVGIRNVLMKALPRFLVAPEEPAPNVRRAIEVPFIPTVPTLATIPALVAGCAIDHSVPPVAATRGGTQAGQARLRDFLATGLPRYAAERGDPNAGATSRLSPYLHFGNVSPHEVILAVHAAGVGGDGASENAAKFIDEALVWRELSHNFCFYDPKHHTAEAIPGWAQVELEKHRTDPRPVLYTDAEIEGATTGEPLWNAAQRQYLRDGFMHNSLRMLWGKAVLAWTPDAATTLRILEHNNNKYSLDGRDSSTYGGIHWIFGKFDRPFFRRPIYGTVRFMSLKTAKDKFDVAALVHRYPA
jgi:deoxyribodipyrimidine photo-lyase